MKVLCIGDPHIEEKRLSRCTEMIEAAISVAKKESPNYIVIMGDTLDRFKTINQYALKLACDFFYSLSEIAPLFVLIGNHDRPSHADFMTPDNPFYAMKHSPNITIITTTTVIWVPQLESNFVFVPYVATGRFEEALSNVDLSSTRCVFAHQELYKCNYNGITSTKGDKWPSSNPLLISGHIHKYQRIGNNIIYVGTPIQITSDEENGKTVSLFTFTASDHVERRISLGCKEFKRLVMTGEQFRTWNPTNKYYWHITIKDNRGEMTLVQTSAKYQQLRATIQFDEIEVSEIRLEDIYEIKTSSYVDLLCNRVKNDPLQLSLLQSLL